MGPKNLEVTKFASGDYVLPTYLNCPPNKLAGMYRGPMVITSIDRPDLIKVRDLITNLKSMEHANRICPFKHSKSMSKEKIETFAATDLDESYIEKIIGHSGTGKNPKKGNFRVRWLGYKPEDATICWIGQRSRTSQPWTSIVKRIPTSI